MAAALQVPVILMHARGDPRTMQDNPSYADVVLEVRDFLVSRMEACVQAGLAREKLVIDPGIGFGKTLEHNLALMRSLSVLTELGAPVLLGASRKRFIASLDRQGAAEDRLGGSLAAVMTAWQQGVRWFRVHDVAATRQALAVLKSLETTG